ncbi:MAG: cupin-like domain-containing protein [Acidobacteriota bacterium]
MSSARLSPSPSVAVPTVPDQAARRRLDIEGDVFGRDFNRRPFTIGHHLRDHPLLTLPSLIELSKRLPESNVRYNRADVDVSQAVYTAPKTGLSIQETIRQIEECGSWMVLRFVEQDPQYRALVDQCLDEIQQFTDPIMPGMFKREGFVFITSPGGVTPFHMDPEYNFLLQIRGKKTASLLDVSDRSIVSEELLEKFLSGDEYKHDFKDEYPDKAFTFELNPGEGLHFPLNWPHWVKNDDEVSISFSITFRSLESERTSIVYSVNNYLRRRGFNPTPYGRSALRDTAKFNAFRAMRRAKKLLRVWREESPQRY